MLSRHSLRFYQEKIFRSGEDYYSLNGYRHYEAIFVHIPKTGGVSVSKALYGSLGWGHVPYSELTNYLTADEVAKFYKFAIVRNPIDRFISAINYLHGGGLSPADIEWADEYLRPYRDINEFISKELKKHTSTKHHFRTQTSYIVDKSGKLGCMDFIGRHENIKEDFRQICNSIGIKRSLKHHNKSKSKIITRDQISTTSIQILYDIYSIDFTNLNYPRT